MSTLATIFLVWSLAYLIFMLVMLVRVVVSLRAGAAAARLDPAFDAARDAALALSAFHRATNRAFWAAGQVVVAVVLLVFSR